MSDVKITTEWASVDVEDARRKADAASQSLHALLRAVSRYMPPHGSPCVKLYLLQRPLRESDIPILQAWATASGFEYPDPGDPAIVEIMVIADDGDVPIVAVAAKRLVELFAWVSPTAGADLRIDAIVAMHAPMIEALKRHGFECAEAFLPPQMERRGFGRFLSRLGWRKNWPSWGFQFR